MFVYYHDTRQVGDQSPNEVACQYVREVLRRTTWVQSYCTAAVAGLINCRGLIVCFDVVLLYGRRALRNWAFDVPVNLNFCESLK